ncbi:MAG: TIGR00300 family protein [Planctomycetota bacterium]|nr:TIGR00300 family protein [Planctomycetota bacterium]
MDHSETQIPFVEDVEVSGHIIDSLLLPKILDCVTSRGGQFQISKINIGQQRSDPSIARVRVQAESREILEDILGVIADHGAVRVSSEDCRLVEADMNGVFPDGFYSSTNQRCEIRVGGNWIPVKLQEMDCGITLDLETGEARCIPMLDVVAGQQLVVGHMGVRVYPEERRGKGPTFEFMDSAVSSEKPKRLAARQVANWLTETRRDGGKTLIVGGPAIVHTGSTSYICELIRRGYIHKIFAGNALATHDIENSLYHTSLGVNLEHGENIHAGHEHHLRAINTIRRCGSIVNAVEQGVLTSGVMFECVQNEVDFLLAGSIRDDGPLPDVITDCVEAQRQMRAGIRDVTFCLMLSTMLHSVAVGNLLPAHVRVVCVDINPSAVIKLSDRGSFQTIPIVTDIEPFLRAMLEEVAKLDGWEIA